MNTLVFVSIYGMLRLDSDHIDLNFCESFRRRCSLAGDFVRHDFDKDKVPGLRPPRSSLRIGSHLRHLGDVKLYQLHQHTLPPRSNLRIGSHLRHLGDVKLHQLHQHTLPPRSSLRIGSHLRHLGDVKLHQLHQHTLPPRSKSL